MAKCGTWVVTLKKDVIQTEAKEERVTQHVVGGGVGGGGVPR
jgi:hypothetical protein